MKLRMILASAAVAAVAAAPAAQAQTDPVRGGTNVGGVVNSFLELALTPPSKQFASFSKTKSYDMTFDAYATTTDGTALLSLADGDVASGSKLGRIAVGKKVLPSPLETTVGSAAFQPLNGTVDPLLRKFSTVGNRMKTTIKLRQKVKGKATGSYRKVLLVTLSTETP
jgi:hypothetical protein